MLLLLNPLNSRERAPVKIEAGNLRIISVQTVAYSSVNAFKD